MLEFNHVFCILSRKYQFLNHMISDMTCQKSKRCYAVTAVADDSVAVAVICIFLYVVETCFYLQVLTFISDMCKQKSYLLAIDRSNAMSDHKNFTNTLVLEIWKACSNFNPPRLGLATFNYVYGYVQLKVSAIIHN